MSKSTGNKILAPLLVVAMVFTMMPLTAFAEGEIPLGDSGKTATSTDIVIAAFDELPEGTLWQDVDYGTVTTDELDLPDTLTGTDADDNAITIDGMTWQSEPAFDPAVSAWYCFSPILPQGYILADGVTAPVINVFMRPQGGVGIQPLGGGAYDYQIDLAAINPSADATADGYTITNGDTINLAQANSSYRVYGTTTAYYLYINAANISLTLDNASVTTTSDYAILLNEDCSLTLTGTNSLYGSFAGIGGNTLSENLTIGGTGSLTTNLIKDIGVFTMNGGTVNAKIVAQTIDITGGESSNGDATGNTATMTGGAVHNNIVGGQGDTATNNSVTISGGMVGHTNYPTGGNVWGGYSFSGDATGNTVTISGSPTIMGTLYGGNSSGGGDVKTGNRLEIETTGLTVAGVKNFEFMSFYLPATITNNATMLTSTVAVGVRPHQQHQQHQQHPKPAIIS